MLDKITGTKKTIILSLCVIVVIIIVIKIYLSSRSSAKGKEGFTSSQQPLDLLSKLKSNDSQNIVGSANSSDLELSIYPWTTKLHNIQSANQVKAIGLYKPHLTINGKNYTKLGDMISQHADYSPPDNNEFTLLLEKPGSDVKAPTDFMQIVKFGDETQATGYRKYDAFIKGNTNLTMVADKLTNCAGAISSLTNIVNQNMNGINMILRNLITCLVNFKYGYQRVSLWEIFKHNQGTPIIPYFPGNDILGLPYGVTVGFTYPYDWHDDPLPDYKTGNGSNINSVIFKSDTAVILLNNATYGLTNSKQGIETVPITVNIFALIDPNTIKTYLTGLCNDIISILTLPNMTPEFFRYLNLADNINGVNSILAQINSITGTNIHVPGYTDFNSLDTLPIDPSLFHNLFAENSTISSYASGVNTSGTLLGKILNTIISTSITVYYPIILFKKTDLQYMNFPAYTRWGWWWTPVSSWLASVTKVQFRSYDLSWVDSSVVLQPLMRGWQDTVDNLFSPVITETIQFSNALANNQIDYFPIQIYAPIPPKGYTALGHVFCNVNNDLVKIKNMNNVACVPEHCVKEMREWVAADKVFEINQTGKYWALYLNPFTGTFVSVNKPGLPEGKVCKVVACVAKCNAVDELKKADECARTYQKLNNKLEAGIDKTDLVSSTEESIYLDKIKMQNDNILTLQSRAQQLQTDLDKADILHTELNKAALQNYVDTQKRNIELVADRLDQDQNKIETNITVPIETLNQIIQAIQRLEALSAQQKQDIINKIISNAQSANSGLLNQQQYNANLNNILRSCPNYDLTGLVKKSLVGDVCYGCGTP